MKNATFSKIKKLTGTRGISYFLVYLFSVLQSIITVIFALAVKDLVNVVASPSVTGKAVIISATFCVLTVVLAYVFGVLVQLISQKLKINTEIKLKKLVFDSYVKNNYASQKQIKSGEFISIINHDTTLVSSVYISLLPSIVSVIVKIVTTIVVLVLLQPIFTLIVLLAGVFIVLITYFVRKVTAKLHKRVLKQDSECMNYINDCLDNSLYVKAMNGEDRVIYLNDEKLSSYSKAKKNQRYFSSVLSSVTGLMFMLFYVATVIWGAVGIYKGVSGIDFGVLTAMLQLVMQIRTPFSSLSSSFTAYYEMRESFRRIEKVLPKESIQEKYSLNNFESIDLDGVTFSYSQEPLISNLSLKISKGEKIVIMGQSGIGKSTLLKIITGVLESEKGKANIISENKEFSLYSVQNVFTSVFQGNLLFSGTIRDNICFFRKFSEKDYQKAIYLAGLEDVISSMPQKDLTYIGEKGNSLSEGQAERVALARAIFTGYPVLILDEFTSALDSQTENLVLSRLFSEFNGTIIAVSHKKAIEKYCDTVYHFENGKLVKSN